MKLRYSPLLAVLVTLAIGGNLPPGLAQLPPTNMGKFVHQPGDNQYSDATQATRHGSPAPPPQQFVQTRAVNGFVPTPAAPKPDPTLEPIAADEPVPVAGFPPLPDRLDLPVSSGSSWSGAGGGGGGGGGYHGGGGAAPGMSSGGGIQETFHQHYGHVAPGAFLPPKSDNSDASGGGGGGGGGHGYYKAVDPGLPARSSHGYYKASSPGGDYYNANTGGAPGGPAYTGAGQRDLSALGKEPKLNDGTGGMPDAPAPVVVNQSTTQDLSLPDDEFAYHPKKPGIGHAIHQAVRGPLNSVGAVTGVHF